MQNKIVTRYFNKNKTLVVAELSGNHNLKFKSAVKMINEAKKAGADAIKVQLYTPDTITFNSSNKDFLLGSDNKWSKNKNLYSLYQKAYTPWSWYPKLKKLCDKKKLFFFPSVFDSTSVDFAIKHKADTIKIASPEINDIHLLKYISKTNISIVMLSTGLANLSEIKEAINIFKKNINIKIVLMKCNSAYPAILKDMNLKTIGTYKKKFNVIPGLSDHSLDSLAPVVAVSYGAKVIEKHFSLSKKSIDGFFSLNKNEFKRMVSQIREVEALIGNTSYEISKDSKKNLFAKRSLYVVKDIGINEKFNLSNVKSIRPAHGISSRYLEKIIGKKSNKNLKAGSRMSLKYLIK